MHRLSVILCIFLLAAVLAGCSGVDYRKDDAPGTYHYGHPGHEVH